MEQIALEVRGLVPDNESFNLGAGYIAPTRALLDKASSYYDCSSVFAHLRMPQPACVLVPICRIFGHGQDSNLRP
jgi:hypothetical protein